MSDEYRKFVKKAIIGDKNAFAELYRIFLDRIYRFIYYLVDDEFLAEDITQNTFLKAWNNLRNFSLTKGTYQSYLYTIARNLVIDHQRKKKEISLELTVGENLRSETDLVEGVARNESIAKVREALSILEEDDRQIIILRYFEDMSYDEIAAVIGKKPGAIRVRVHRLLEVLKNNLEK
ncbi:MAG: hypothetical protein ACD_13C00193G0011 [uncultured bacterium]|nr:MAG: hypothetical protein ACD_13C00193G0011 [uncultured bacterium]